MILDLQGLAKLIGILVTIAGGVTGLSIWIKKCIENTMQTHLDTIEERLSNRLDALEERIRQQESWNAKQQIDIDANNQYNLIATKGIKLCLEILSFDSDRTDDAKKAIGEMNDFILQQAHRGNSTKKG